MFAEDAGLLGDGLFTKLLEAARPRPDEFAGLARDLFGAMSRGGRVGFQTIEWFNGGLFESDAALPLTRPQIERVLDAAGFDWRFVDPSILGTLFERGLDPAKRSQLGAHYTDPENILRIVNPVVLEPLAREWEATKLAIEDAKRPLDKRRRLDAYLDRLRGVTVLDPACGSGNFLYLALRGLKDLEHRVLLEAESLGLERQFPQIGPEVLRGIELSAYAAELARVSVWIGELQWQIEHGFNVERNPILKPLGTIENRDALLTPHSLALSEPTAERDEPAPVTPLASYVETPWPDAEFIVGNPPFLGGKLLRRELGDAYVDALFGVYAGRVPREADLCAYWFEKARAAIAAGSRPPAESIGSPSPRPRGEGGRRPDEGVRVANAPASPRAGLIATQAIRGGANRRVLQRIKETGDIFLAWSDLEWTLDGANVHVSIVGFDGGEDAARTLNGSPVAEIHANLTAEAAVHTARRLPENVNLCFMGTTKGGPFDITEERVRAWLQAPNPHGRPNSDVLVPWINGRDVTQRDRGMWIVDFGIGMPKSEAALYEAPFGYAETHIESARRESRTTISDRWWQQERPRGEMRAALLPLQRVLVTPNVTKHRLFVWVTAPVQPDHQLFAFAIEDDYTFGVLHSRFHELWARAQGTQLREVESGFRYTPTTCFETFPFPQPDEAQRAAISEAARNLDALREGWLNPPEWTREESLTFPATVGGPWHRWIEGADTLPPGTVAEARYLRRLPRPENRSDLAPRTLTSLYNSPPTWLRHAHTTLDTAVAAAYNLPPELPTPALLAALLGLNLAAG